VSLWRDPDDVSHCRILFPDKTEWRLISVTLCFVADQLWLMKRIRKEEDSVMPLRRLESKRMTSWHEQNYFTTSEHRIFELTIKQFWNLKGPSRFAINRWNLLHNRLLCTASTSSRRRWHLICASRFNSISSAAGGDC